MAARDEAVDGWRRPSWKYSMVAGQMVAGELVEEDRWQAEVESRFAAKRGRAGGVEPT